MGDRWIDRGFGDVALEAVVVVAAAVFRQGARCTFILWAVWKVRVITSPTRPMAWESLAMIEKAPRS
jgi:hypothetical protein